MSKKNGYSISGLCIAIAMVLSIITLINYNENKSIKVDEQSLSFYIEGEQTTTIPSDTSAYSATVNCNNDVIADWDSTNSILEINDLTGKSTTEDGISNFKCNLAFSDTVAPTIVSVTPTGTSVAITGTTLSITFDEEMDTSYGSVSVSPSITLSDMVWSNDNKTVTYTITSTLAYLTKYTITISDFRDISNNIMTSTNIYNFTTIGKNLLPTGGQSITSYTSGRSVYVLSFSESMSSSYGSLTISPATITIESKTWSNSNNTLTYVLSGTPCDGTYITFTLTGFKDTSGNKMSEKTWTMKPTCN